MNNFSNKLKRIRFNLKSIASLVFLPFFNHKQQKISFNLFSTSKGEISSSTIFASSIILGISVITFLTVLLNLKTGRFNEYNLDWNQDLSGNESVNQLKQSKVENRDKISNIDDKGNLNTFTKLLTSPDGIGLSSSNSGLEYSGENDQNVSLLQGCEQNQVLRWDDIHNVWKCSDSYMEQHISKVRLGQDRYDLSLLSSGESGQLLSKDDELGFEWVDIDTYFDSGNDVDIDKKDSKLIIGLEDDIDVSTITSDGEGLSFYGDDGGDNLGLYINEYGNVSIGGSKSPVVDLQVGDVISKVEQLDGDGDAYISDNLEVDGDIYLNNEALYTNVLGDREYTNNYYVNGGETFTSSIDKLDKKIHDLSGSGLWTDTGSITYLTAQDSDFAIGGDSLGNSLFSIDTGTGSFYVDSNNSVNPTFIFESTDGDVGNFGFNNDDTFYFSGANVDLGTGYLVGEGGEEGVYIDSYGNVGIGTNTPSQKVDIYGKVVLGNHQNDQLDPAPTTFMINDDTQITSGKYTGFQNATELNPTGDSNAWYVGSYYNFGIQAGNPYDFNGRLVGAQIQVDHFGSGTIKDAYASRNLIVLRNNGNYTNAYIDYVKGFNIGSGTMSNLYGNYIANPTNSGTIENNYALYIENPTAGNDNYSIYSAGGKNYFGGNVGIGTLVPSVDLDVHGNVQMGNRGNTQIASGYNVVLIDEQIATTSGYNFGLQTGIEVDPPTDSSAWYYGNYYNVGTKSGNDKNFTGRLVGVQAQIDHYGSGTISSAFGVRSTPVNRNNGHYTNVYGYYANMYNVGSGNVDNNYGLYVGNPVNNGTISNNYAIYIDDQRSGTNNYSIYSLGGKNYFGGDVGIGIADPAYNLDVNGSVRMDQLITPYKNVVTVDAGGGGDYTTINDAISYINSQGDASSSNPYVIKVKAGTYTEDITLPDYVSLSGEGWKATVVDGVVTIGSGSHIENLWIYPTGNVTEAVVANPTVSTSYMTNTYVVINNSVDAVTSLIKFVGSTDFRVYSSFLYARNPNSGGSAKSVVLKHEGSGDLEVHRSHLKSSTPNNSNAVLAWNASTSSGADIIVSGSWSVFNDVSPVGADNDNPNGQIKLSLDYENDLSDYSQYLLEGNNVVIEPKRTGNIYVTSPTNQMTLGYDDLNTTVFDVDSAGDMTITPSGGFISIDGNLGIGTTNPSAELDVQGNIKANGLTGQSASSLVYTTASNASHYFYNGSTLNLSIDESNVVGVGFNPTGGSKLGVAGNLQVGSNYINISAPTNGAIIEGNVGIGTTTPAESLDVNGNARFQSVGSGVYAYDLNLTSDGTLTTSASDIRLKKDIVPLAESVLDKVLKLNPVRFKWKNDPDNRTDFGLIAQEVDEIFPEITFTNPNDGYMGINYTRLTPILVKSIQEQQEEMLDVKSDLDNLSSDINGILDSKYITKEDIGNYVEGLAGGTDNNDNVNAGKSVLSVQIEEVNNKIQDLSKKIDELELKFADSSSGLESDNEAKFDANDNLSTNSSMGLNMMGSYYIGNYIGSEDVERGDFVVLSNKVVGSGYNDYVFPNILDKASADGGLYVVGVVIDTGDVRELTAANWGMKACKLLDKFGEEEAREMLIDKTLKESNIDDTDSSETYSNDVLSDDLIRSVDDQIASCDAKIKVKDIKVITDGIVTVNADESSGKISAGDLLTLSNDNEGYVSKLNGDGWVVAQALEDSDEYVGAIKVRIVAPWYNGGTSSAFDSSSGSDSDTSYGVKLESDGEEISLDTESGFEIPANGKLTVFGDAVFTSSTTVNNLTINGLMSVGLMDMDGVDGSINVNGESLKLQNNENAGNVDFFNGKIVFDADGNIFVKDGIVAANQYFVTITNSKNNDDKNDSHTNNSIGDDMIKAGEKSVTVHNEKVSNSSKIFITPRSVIRNQQLSVTDIDNGKFTVSLAEPLSYDVKFDYWIIGVKTLDDEEN